ncbi:hypothetical protein DFJ63DRAFT_200130 [Scheffersomyces coipomensis]|uniref:uncharacterized protein n=1 Tax=Scheffersomyces coipomensis TaxID=1788519 RepID=UPI00315D7927
MMSDKVLNRKEKVPNTNNDDNSDKENQPPSLPSQHEVGNNPRPPHRDMPDANNTGSYPGPNYSGSNSRGHQRNDTPLYFERILIIQGIVVMAVMGLTVVVVGVGAGVGTVVAGPIGGVIGGHYALFHGIPYMIDHLAKRPR